MLSGCNPTINPAPVVESYDPYKACVDKARETYDFFEETRSEAVRACLTTNKCTDKELNNLLDSEKNILKLLEDDKKACEIKYKY